MNKSEEEINADYRKIVTPISRSRFRRSHSTSWNINK
jgi:hypothetical protein